MDRRGKLKLALIAILVLLLIISFVYSTNVIELPFIKKPPKFELINQYEYNFSDLPIKVYDYKSKSQGPNFKVQIMSFNDSKELDNWISYKVIKSSENKTVGKEVFYIDELKNYVFWRSGDKTFVQIIAIDSGLNDSNSITKSLRNNGKGIFSDKLISDYLLSYPSSCDSEGCYSKETKTANFVWENLKWFDSLPEDFKGSSYYIGDSNCPLSDQEWAEVGKNPALTSSELDELKRYCSSHGTYKSSNGETIPVLVKNCGKEIDLKLRSNGIYEYDGEETLDECLLRERFLEYHKSYSQELINTLFEEKDRRLVRDMVDLEELEKEKRANSVLTAMKGGQNEKDSNSLSSHYWFER